MNTEIILALLLPTFPMSTFEGTVLVLHWYRRVDCRNSYKWAKQQAYYWRCNAMGSQGWRGTHTPGECRQWRCLLEDQMERKTKLCCQRPIFLAIETSKWNVNTGRVSFFFQQINHMFVAIILFYNFQQLRQDVLHTESLKLVSQL